MKKLTIVLCFLSQFVVGQTIYQSHEVEKTAEPQGGFAYLKQFAADNFQTPFQARLKGIKGRVFVSGVVEPDGSMSDIKIVKGLEPRCDKEATRVMSLYKAWTPAQKEGKAVRQNLSYFIDVKAEPVKDYDANSQAVVRYFTADLRPAPNAENATFKFVRPIDSLGVTNGDITIANIDKPKLSLKIPRKVEKTTYHFSSSEFIEAEKISYKSDLGQEFAPIFIKDLNGNVLSRTEFNDVYEKETLYNFAKNGMLKERVDYQTDYKYFTTIWNPKGQIILKRLRFANLSAPV